MSKSKYLYLLVTDDDYELPLVVCDTPTELAKIAGTTVNTVISSIFRVEHGKLKRSKYNRVLKEYFGE